jgi:hypothetical protein
VGKSSRPTDRDLGGQITFPKVLSLFFLNNMPAENWGWWGELAPSSTKTEAKHQQHTLGTSRSGTIKGRHNRSDYRVQKISSLLMNF